MRTILVLSFMLATSSLTAAPVKAQKPSPPVSSPERSAPASGDSLPFYKVAPPTTNTPFLNEYNSVTVINPAQLGRINWMQATGSIATQQAEGTVKADDFKVKDKMSNQVASVQAAYHLPIGLIPSLKFSQASGVLKTDSTNFGVTDKTKLRQTDGETTVSAAYIVSDEITLGFDYRNAKRSIKFTTAGGTAKGSASFNSFEPGILYNTRAYEVGAVYLPTIHVNKDGTELVRNGAFIFHGSKFVGETTTLDLQLSYFRYNSVADGLKNSVTAQFGPSMRFTGSRFGAHAVFQPSYSKESENASYENSKTLGLILDGYVRTAERFELGLKGEYYVASGDGKFGTVSTDIDAKATNVTAVVSYIQ